jgi:hypothetical protein
MTAQDKGAKTAAAANAPQGQPPPLRPWTARSARSRSLSSKQAKAIPEDKFNLSPESLNLAAAEYKGVRTFAGQVKHVATSNYFIWPPITGDKLPESSKNGNGPGELKTKAEIIKFLKDPFALGHKAAGTLTTENMSQAPTGSKSTRLALAAFGVAWITADPWSNTCE